MTLAGLLTEPVTVQTASDAAVDPSGDVVTSFSAGTVYLGRLEQRAAQEVTDGRDTFVSDWVLYLHPDVVVNGRDRVVDGFGRTFEVVGAPDMERTPRGPHHLVVNLRYAV